METKTEFEIAKIIGVADDKLLGGQDWTPPLRPHMRVSLLHWKDDRPQVCFRVVDTQTGQGWTALPDEASADLVYDPAAVANAYGALLKPERQKNLEVWPAIHAAVPDLDPQIPRIEISGKTMLVDIAPGGALQNLRPVPAGPVFSMTDQDELAVDISAMDPAAQATISDSLQKLAAPPLVTGP